MDDNNDGFLRYLADKLRQLAEEDAHLGNTLRGIEERRKELAQQMDQMRRTEAIYSGWKAPTPSNGISPGPVESTGASQEVVVSGNLSTMTVAEAAETVMRSMGGKATVKVLVETLHRHGKLRDGGAAGYAIVYPALRKAPQRFRQVDKATWGLAEHTGSHDPEEGGMGEDPFASEDRGRQRT